MKPLYTSLLTLSFLASNAHGVMLIQDNFARSGPLAGSAAAPVPGPGVWTGGAQTTNPIGQADITYNVTAGDLSYQSITLAPSTLYTMSVIMAATGGQSGASWLAFGFGGTVGSGASILLENSGNASAFTSSSISSLVGSGSAQFSMKLTTDATAATSTVNYFRNGVQFGPTNSVISTATTNQAFLQNSKDISGHYNRFSLEATAVPEPSSFFLLSGLGLGLLVRRRR